MPLYSPPSSYDGPEQVKYLFIDGGSLDSLLEELSKGLLGGVEIEIDYRYLARGYQKVFYYDCFPAQRRDEAEADYQLRIKPKIKLFNTLQSIDGFHVYEGTARYRNKQRGGQEQKQVDIMIAVDMLTHSFRRNMHEATLLTGDLDFKPLIDGLVQEGMYVSLWYPKGRANYELVDAADSRLALTIHTIENWFTDKFREKVRLPAPSEGKLHYFDRWRHLEPIKEATYEGVLAGNDGEFAAYVQMADGGKVSYLHDNIEQLKFYVNHIHSPNVFRQNKS